MAKASEGINLLDQNSSKSEDSVDYGQLKYYQSAQNWFEEAKTKKSDAQDDHSDNVIT